MPTLNILLVEDEAGLRETFRRVLAEEGHDVTTAADGREADALLRSHTDFDLMITDRDMPGMSGERLIRIARERYPTIRIIAMSSDDHEAILRVLMAAGADRAVSKFYFAERYREIIAFLFPG